MKKLTRAQKSAAVRKQVAEERGISPQAVGKLVHRGMPLTSLKGALAWCKANLTQRQAIGSLADETTRLKAVQADLAELDLALRRGELMERETVLTVVSAATVIFRTQLDGLAGRVAGEVAGMDPAMARQRVFDEGRRILAAVAAEFRKLALGPDGGPGGAAAE